MCVRMYDLCVYTRVRTSGGAQAAVEAVALAARALGPEVTRIAHARRVLVTMAMARACIRGGAEF